MRAVYTKLFVRLFASFSQTKVHGPGPVIGPEPAFLFVRLVTAPIVLVDSCGLLLMLLRLALVLIGYRCELSTAR